MAAGPMADGAPGEAADDGGVDFVASDIDDFMRLAGGFGRYQLRVATLAGLLRGLAGLNTMVWYYMAIEPTVGCAAGSACVEDDVSLAAYCGDPGRYGGNYTLEGRLEGVTVWFAGCAPPRWMGSVIGACFFAGCIVGGIICGRLSDRFGRIPTFFTFAAVSSILLFMSTAAPNIQAYCVLMVLHGVSVGGYYTPCYVFASESVPTKHAGTTGSLVSLCYSVMVVVAVLLAYPKTLHNWRYFSWLVAALNMSCLAFYPVMVESPRWVMNRHGTRSPAFLSLMLYIARVNGIEIEGLIDAHQTLVAGAKSLRSYASMSRMPPMSAVGGAGKDLGGVQRALGPSPPASCTSSMSAPPLSRRVKSVNCLFAVPPQDMVATDSNGEPPTALARSVDNIALSRGAGFGELFRDYGMTTMNVNFLWFSTSLGYFGLSYSTSRIGGDLYVNGIVMGLVELPAAFCSGLCLNSPLGRRKTMMLLCSVAGGSCIVTPFLPGWSSTACAFLGKFAVSVAYYVACVWVSELFPTHLRGLAAGMAGSSAFFAGLTSPFILEYAGAEVAIPVFGIGVVVAGVMSMLLPDTTPPNDDEVQHGVVAPALSASLRAGERVMSGIFRAQSSGGMSALSVSARSINAMASAPPGSSVWGGRGEGAPALMGVDVATPPSAPSTVGGPPPCDAPPVGSPTLLPLASCNRPRVLIRTPDAPTASSDATPASQLSDSHLLRASPAEAFLRAQGGRGGAPGHIYATGDVDGAVAVRVDSDAAERLPQAQGGLHFSPSVAS